MAERQRSTDTGRGRDDRGAGDEKREEPRRPNPHRKDAYDAIAELEKLIGVDKHALDDNLEAQPDLFYRVSKAFTIALSHADIAKAHIDELEASLDGEVRADMERAGDKVTETAVKQAIKAHRDMRAAISDHLEKREIAGRWGSLKDTFNQRSYVMKELVSLYTAGYFTDATGGRASRDIKDVKADRAGEARTRALAERDGGGEGRDRSDDRRSRRDS